MPSRPRLQWPPVPGPCPPMSVAHPCPCQPMPLPMLHAMPRPAWPERRRRPLGGCGVWVCQRQRQQLGTGRPSLTPTLCGRRSSRGPLYIGNRGPDPGRISASHVGGFGPWTKNEYTRSARRLAYIITECGAGQTRRGVLSCLYALLPATPTITCFEQRQGPVGDTAILRRTHHNHIHTSAGAVTDNHEDEHRECTT